MSKILFIEKGKTAKDGIEISEAALKALMDEAGVPASRWRPMFAKDRHGRRHFYYELPNGIIDSWDYPEGVAAPLEIDHIAAHMRRGRRERFILPKLPLKQTSKDAPYPIFPTNKGARDIISRFTGWIWYRPANVCEAEAAVMVRDRSKTK